MPVQHGYKLQYHIDHVMQIEVSSEVRGKMKRLGLFDWETLYTGLECEEILILWQG